MAALYKHSLRGLQTKAVINVSSNSRKTHDASSFPMAIESQKAYKLKDFNRKVLFKT
jgi:hypothetical protein